jgi:anti-sigma regulatory factor (Ser/Thr protein kinase)
VNTDPSRRTGDRGRAGANSDPFRHAGDRGRPGANTDPVRHTGDRGRPGANTDPFRHTALLYRGAADYVSATTTTVRGALEAGDRVLVAVPGPNLDLLRDALDDVAGRIVFADMAVAGRNPGRILPGVLLDFYGRRAGKRVTVIGEPVWDGRTDLEMEACAVHEALINAVFAGRNAAIMCPYDVSRLRPAAVTGAWRTHPVMLDGGLVHRSTSYTDPLATADDLDLPLPPVPAYAKSCDFGDWPDLSQVRAFVRHAAAPLLGSGRVDDLVMAANELVTNAVRHTATGGRIAVWTEAGVLVCQIDDAGPWPGPLAGRMMPLRDDTSGRGLILVNELCDLVRLHRHQRGTSVRVHIGAVTT